MSKNMRNDITEKDLARKAEAAAETETARQELPAETGEPAIFYFSLGGMVMPLSTRA